MGEVHKLDAKRNSNRHVMAQTNKDLSHVKKAAVTTEQQLHDKEELLEQASFWLLLLLPSLSNIAPGWCSISVSSPRKLFVARNAHV